MNVDFFFGSILGYKYTLHTQQLNCMRQVSVEITTVVFPTDHRVRRGRRRCAQNPAAPGATRWEHLRMRGWEQRGRDHRQCQAVHHPRWVLLCGAACWGVTREDAFRVNICDSQMVLWWRFIYLFMIAASYGCDYSAMFNKITVIYIHAWILVIIIYACTKNNQWHASLEYYIYIYENINTESPFTSYIY